jgi:uncharacterized protein
VTTALLALPFGLAIGLSLGLVGGGGAIIAVPVLVYVLGESVKQATTASLVIVGATALVGAFDPAAAAVSACGSRSARGERSVHSSARRSTGSPTRHDWAVAAAFTAGGVAGALAGSRVSARVPAVRLREAFALLVTALAAVLLARDAISVL